jgi:hypothetical protein
MIGCCDNCGRENVPVSQSPHSLTLRRPPQLSARAWPSPFLLKLGATYRVARGGRSPAAAGTHLRPRKTLRWALPPRLEPGPDKAAPLLDRHIAAGTGSLRQGLMLDDPQVVVAAAEREGEEVVG